MGLKMRNKIPVLTEKEVMEIIKKKAKGTVTAMADKAVQVMQVVTKENLYDQRLASKGGAYPGRSAYDRTHSLYRSITRGKTENFGDSFSNGVSFSIDYLRAHKTSPIYRATRNGKRKLVKFGSYTDVDGFFVGDSMIEEGWIEDGTEPPSIVPRRGANILGRTASEMDALISGHGFDVEFINIGAEIEIQKYR